MEDSESLIRDSRSQGESRSMTIVPSLNFPRNVTRQDIQGTMGKDSPRTPILPQKAQRNPGFLSQVRSNQGTSTPTPLLI